MPCRLQPAPPGRGGEGGHPRRRRHADGVQHDRRQRRREHGHRGHEGEPRLPRGDRGFDRDGPAATCSTASSPWSAATRRSRARRWRSCAWTSRGWSSTTARSPRALQGQERRHRHRLRGRRRLPGGKDQPPGALRHRERLVPGRRCLRRPVHGEHHEHGDGVHGAQPRGLDGIPAEDPAKDAAARRSGELSWTSSPGTSGPRRSWTGGPSRTASPRSRRRAAPPTACCTCSRSRGKRVSRSRSTSFRRLADRTPIVADLKPGGRYSAAALYDVVVCRPGDAGAAEALAPARGDAERGRADPRRRSPRRLWRRRARTWSCSSRRRSRPPVGSRSSTARRRRGRRDQARRPRAPPPHGTGAGLRQRERVLRGREGGRDPAGGT